MKKLKNYWLGEIKRLSWLLRNGLRRQLKYTKRFGFLLLLYFWEEEIKSSHFTLTLKAKTTKQQNMKTNVYGDLLQVFQILLCMKGELVRRLWKNKRMYLNHNNENKERYKKLKDLTFVLEMSLSNKQISCRRKKESIFHSLKKMFLNLNWNYHNVPSSNANLVTVKSFKINN